MAFEYVNRPAPSVMAKRSLRSRKTSITHYSDIDVSSNDGAASEEYESQSESWGAISDGSETVRKGQAHLHPSHNPNVRGPLFFLFYLVSNQLNLQARRTPSTPLASDQLQDEPTTSKSQDRSQKTPYRSTKSSRSARKADDSSEVEDPIRTYCLQRLRDVITPIFEESASNGSDTPDSVTQKAELYVNALEQHLFHAFKEPDKVGIPVVGNKYKCVGPRLRILMDW